MARISTMTTSPAAETAAAVNEPETAEAIDKPASMRVMTNMRTAPNGVFIMLTIDPPVLPPLPMFCFSTLP